MYTTLHPTQKHLCLPQSTSPMSKSVAVTMAQMITDKRRGKKKANGQSKMVWSFRITQTTSDIKRKQVKPN